MNFDQRQTKYFSIDSNISVWLNKVTQRMLEIISHIVSNFNFLEGSMPPNPLKGMLLSSNTASLQYKHNLIQLSTVQIIGLLHVVMITLSGKCCTA